MNNTSENNLLDIIRNLCNLLVDNGIVFEEVIEAVVDTGADIAVLKAIGFSDSQIDDYAYYESLMSGKSEEVLAEIQ